MACFELMRFPYVDKHYLALLVYPFFELVGIEVLQTFDRNKTRDQKVGEQSVDGNQ